MSVVVYGLPNCDSTREVLKALKGSEIEFSFHDLRKDGVELEKIEQWIVELGTEKLLNKRSSGWRELQESEKSKADNAAGAVTLISQKITLAKRPILEINGKLLAGREATEMIHLVTKK